MENSGKGRSRAVVLLYPDGNVHTPLRPRAAS